MAKEQPVEIGIYVRLILNEGMLVIDTRTYQSARGGARSNAASSRVKSPDPGSQFR